MKKQSIKPLTLGSAVALTAVMASSSFAAENPFSATALKAGYEVSFAGEGNCGEGKCGEGKKKEGSCGEGKCGEDKKKEGSCGEGKCGEDKKKEGSCGEGKCGEGKCGE